MNISLQRLQFYFYIFGPLLKSKTRFTTPKGFVLKRVDRGKHKYFPYDVQRVHAFLLVCFPVLKCYPEVQHIYCLFPISTCTTSTQIVIFRVVKQFIISLVRT